MRNAALVRVLLTTGALQHARLPDDLDQRDGHSLLHYRAKGGAWQEKVLVPYAATVLDADLALRTEREGAAVSDLTRPLFVGCPYRGRPGGQPLASRYLGDLIRRLAREASITKRGIVPHSTRQTVATSLGRHRSLAELQTYLDHADPRTTASTCESPRISTTAPSTRCLDSYTTIPATMHSHRLVPLNHWR